jgi:hypothetical protein
MDKLIKDTVTQAKSKALVVFGSVVMAFVGLAGIAAFFFTPSHLKLGFFASLKEYLDESADLSSIFLFACLISNLKFIQYIVDVVYQIKQANRQTKINFSPLETVLNRGQFFAPFVFSCIIVLASLALSFWIFEERSAVNFFKNSLDEVADVCSMLSVAVPMYIGMRIKKFIEVISGAALLYLAAAKDD